MVYFIFTYGCIFLPQVEKTLTHVMELPSPLHPLMLPKNLLQRARGHSKIDLGTAEGESEREEKSIAQREVHTLNTGYNMLCFLIYCNPPRELYIMRQHKYAENKLNRTCCHYQNAN